MDNEAREIAEGLTEAGRKDVPGYTGLYQIDEMGNVHSIPRYFTRQVPHRQKVTVRGGTLARTFSRKGYPQVTLYRNGKGKTYEIHRLVCRVFHGEPAQGQEAAHLNGDKADCRASNLAWVSAAENARHRAEHGTALFGERNPASVLTAEKAIAIFKDVHAGAGKREIARMYGISEKAVRKICSGETWAQETESVRTYLEQKQ